MRRREFISAFGATVAAWPFAARAQQAMPVIGFLNSSSEAVQVAPTATFVRGLSEVGFKEAENVHIEYRYAAGEYERLPQMALELINQHAAVIMAGGPPAARAAKLATTTIPIVFTSGDDPVQVGLVSNLARPEANLTGIHIFFTGLESKKLGLLHQLLPQVGTIAVLVNPNFPSSEIQTRDLQTAARVLNENIQIMRAGSEAELESTFAKMKELQIGALLTAADPFFNSVRDKVIALAAENRIPAIYEQRAFAVSGGLMSYGTDVTDAYRQAGVYTGRILKGAKVADLPVLQSTKFELVINLKTAKGLGLDVPLPLQMTADEVIE
jgi:putative ABC transport system substrate-binding protein